MHLSKAVIAICGKSCVGKSTTADGLAHLYGMEIRKCGEAIKARADELAISPQQLSDIEHKAIDSETQQLVASGQPLIVEGVFLDQVLSATKKNVVLIELTCADDERSRRFEHKHANQKLGLKDRDLLDSETAARLYSSSGPKRQPDFRVDTTALTPLEVLGALDRWLKK